MLLRRHKQRVEEPKVEVKEEALTIKEIKQLLDEKGIEYNPKAKKEELEKLLEGAE